MKPMAHIKVVGYNLDQLINKIQKLDIKCYDILREENNILHFSVGIKDCFKIKPLLKIYEHHINYLGLANFKTWFVKNLAILLTIPIAVGLTIFSSQFTWNIKIYGVEEDINNQVIQILEDNNIAIGKFMPRDIDGIEQIILKEIPNVAQVSCIKRGTSIIINISEKLVYTPKEYEPIRATHNGVITNFSLVSGTMAVSIGDFVSKGDILVYPFTLDKQNNQVSVKPIAEIIATAYVGGTSKLNATTTELFRTGKEYTISSIQFLNKNLFSKKMPKPFALYETKVYNECISGMLPIKRIKTTFYELSYKMVNYDLVAEQGRVESESIDLAYQNLPSNSSILDEQTTSLIINDCLYSTTTLTISTIISQ